MKHVMHDLETAGLIPGSAILSIGACFFRPVSTRVYLDERVVGERFYANVNYQSCKDAGLTEDPNTMAWWKRQSQEARDALLVDQVPLKEALWKFSAWFQQHGGEKIWGNGAAFDQPIIEAAYRAVKLLPPWQHWNSRCVRTLLDMGGINHKDHQGQMEGTAHNALSDAVHQARCCALAVGNLFPPIQEESLDELVAKLPEGLRRIVREQRIRDAMSADGIPV